VKVYVLVVNELRRGRNISKRRRRGHHAPEGVWARCCFAKAALRAWASRLALEARNAELAGLRETTWPDLGSGG